MKKIQCARCGDYTERKRVIKTKGPHNKKVYYYCVTCFNFHVQTIAHHNRIGG